MHLVTLPLVVPLCTALLLLFWGRPSRGRRAMATASAVGQLVVALGLGIRTYDEGPWVLPVGNWAAPFGIVLVADLLSAVMIVLGSWTALMAIVYGSAELSVRVEHPLRLPLMQFLVAGINLSFLTGDLFNLFVAFEVMLIASYALLTLEADDWDIKQGFPYVAVNLAGSTLFLCGAGLAYRLFGTLNFADMAQRVAGMADDPRVVSLALLFLAVFGLKAGLFPLYYWLPNSYPILPAPVAALYAGMLTKVGVYVLLRIFGTVLPHELSGVHALLAWLAGATMLLGVVGALSRNFVRGILSYHILSQVGFMMLAIGFFTEFAFAASIFYIIHHIVVKSSLFLIGGTAALLNRTDNLDRMGNLWRHAPGLGVAFLFQALSLAGLPPLSGFWGKFAIAMEGLRLGEYVLVGISLVASILTLLSMLKIWNGAFWNAAEDREVCLWDWRWVRMNRVNLAMVAVSLGIGLGAEGVFQVATRAAQQVRDRDGYAAAVFAVRAKGVDVR
ncbi:MAG: proton-conducting transporter membrane subunit [Limisphaera sp.]|nr:proton-conducting transporter membrane subunit [Limisphaera sp.]